MNTHKHVHEEIFAATPERLFELLHTPSAIRAWWGASRAIVMPEVGGLWSASWGEEDDPDYVTVATLTAYEPPRRMVMSEYRYRAKAGPLPFQADFETEFVVTPCEEGASLRVTQAGFPATPEGEAFLIACDTGWRNTFAGIRRFLEAPDEVA